MTGTSKRFQEEKKQGSQKGHLGCKKEWQVKKLV